MKLTGAIERFKPLQLKLTRKLPLCPWESVFSSLNPKQLGLYPPKPDIQEVDRDGTLIKLRFAGKHDAWFPEQVEINPEMWSEYLSVFWDSPKNGHYYLRYKGIRPGDVVVDCGACEGFFAQQALERGAAKVICVEPSEVMAQCLKRTFEKETASSKVLIRNVAVGAVNGTTQFDFDSLQPFGGHMNAAAVRGSTIGVFALERLVAELGIPKIDFLKMDIEGAEVQAVEGAFSLLEKHKPTLAITTYHRSFDFAVLRALLVSAGYRHIKAAGITDRGVGVYRPVMIHAWEDR
jgi:FkbM family methyltransferase